MLILEAPINRYLYAGVRWSGRVWSEIDLLIVHVLCINDPTALAQDV